MIESPEPDDDTCTTSDPSSGNVVQPENPITESVEQVKSTPDLVPAVPDAPDTINTEIRPQSPSRLERDQHLTVPLEHAIQERRGRWAIVQKIELLFNRDDFVNEANRIWKYGDPSVERKLTH